MDTVNFTRSKVQQLRGEKTDRLLLRSGSPLHALTVTALHTLSFGNRVGTHTHTLQSEEWSCKHKVKFKFKNMCSCHNLCWSDLRKSAGNRLSMYCTQRCKSVRITRCHEETCTCNHLALPAGFCIPHLCAANTEDYSTTGT